MRITNNMVTRNYLSGLQSNYSLLNKYSTQVASGQKFTNMSEDVSSGVRAMKVRRQLTMIDGYKSNVDSASNFLKSAEASLTQMEEINKSVTERWIQAVNGTYEDDDRYHAFATELEKYLDEMVSVANSKYSDRYIFGGTNSIKPPFEYDKDTGVLLYNGVDVTTLTRTHPLVADDAAYIDLGLGLAFDESDPQQVNENSAFKNTIIGVDFLGIGSENTVLILAEMVDMLRSGNLDSDAAGTLQERFSAAAKNLTMQMTALGADTKYLDYTKTRLEDEELNLIERQKQLEVVDPETAIMNLMMQEYVYNACLAIGQRLMQPTLFNFIS